MKLRDWLIPIEAPPAVILIRLATGGVFLSEGIQKFLFPATLGVGRFTRIGIPNPHLMAPLVGAVEIICGTLLILGLLTRLAALPLVIVIVVALLQTKFPYWLQHGFWATAHESRTDVAMLLGSLFLLAVGPGPLSFDTLLIGRGQPAAVQRTTHG